MVTNKDTKDTKVVGIDVREIHKGDLFSEMSHFVVIDTELGEKTKKDSVPEGIRMMHLESGREVIVEAEYVAQQMLGAEHYTKEVIVGREDKLWTQKQIDDLAVDKHPMGKDETLPRVGDVRVEGIRTIWENITDERALAVCFVTQGKAKTKKALEAEREAQITKALSAIDAAQLSKKGVAKAAKIALQDIQDNPIPEYEEGKERILIGYKVQYKSRDGKYNCVDTHIKEKHNIRPVNINTIAWLIVNGTKYVVE